MKKEYTLYKILFEGSEPIVRISPDQVRAAMRAAGVNNEPGSQGIHITPGSEEWNKLQKAMQSNKRNINITDDQAEILRKAITIMNSMLGSK